MERSFVHSKQHVFSWNFFMKSAQCLFSGPNWLFGAFGAKIVPDENFSQFCLKSPVKFVLQKTRFRFEFFFKIAPHLFSWPNGLDGAIAGKSVPERSFVHPKKHGFGWNLLTKPVPYPFSTPNWLYGAFGGKIVPDENFAQFCLKSPLEIVFPKITFSV